ncbi:nucleoside deaminase [Actinocorallia libanotica]|uniref:Nucleoside deaminase n=1 Tax=Actinocorallia libanotica TaxID=46162 RepID=A0ABP4CFL4_9ACTN
MGHGEHLAEAVSLAVESVEKGWGGPFGAVIVHDDRIIARGQNRVLLTGDPTAHAELEAIRKAVQVLNPRAPSIPEEHLDESTLALTPRPEGSPDPLPERARMLKGCAIYTSGVPCPMCMSAIYWARIGAVHYSCGPEAAEEIGFGDAFQYEDFKKPPAERGILLEQHHPELGAAAYRAWERKPDRHPY